MKRLLLAIGVIATVFTACDNTPKYTIKGTIKNVEANKIFLKEYQERKTVIIDSAEINNGTFEFKGSVDKTKICGIFTSKAIYQRPILNLWVENVPFTISYDSKDTKATTIKGGPAQDLYEKFITIFKKLQEDKKPLDERFNKLRADFNTKMNDKKLSKKAKEKLNKELKANEDKIREEFSVFAKKTDEEVLALIKENLSSVVSASIFYQASQKLDLKEAKEIANSFTGEAAQSDILKKIKENIETKEQAIINKEKVAIGKQAPDFTLNTVEGKPLSLSSFKGKLLLVDFWASWCGPCRKTNPEVVKLYNKYHKKGLEILSVSVDRKEAEWKKAIKEDGLVWNQVIDVKDSKKSAASLYGVTGIPHVILIDKNGTIVAKDLHGKELEKKIIKHIK